MNLLHLACADVFGFDQGFGVLGNVYQTSLMGTFGCLRCFSARKLFTDGLKLIKMQ